MPSLPSVFVSEIFSISISLSWFRCPTKTQELKVLSLAKGADSTQLWCLGHGQRSEVSEDVPLKRDSCKTVGYKGWVCPTMLSAPRVAAWSIRYLFSAISFLLSQQVDLLPNHALETPQPQTKINHLPTYVAWYYDETNTPPNVFTSLLFLVSPTEPAGALRYYLPTQKPIKQTPASKDGSDSSWEPCLIAGFFCSPFSTGQIHAEAQSQILTVAQQQDLYSTTVPYICRALVPWQNPRMFESLICTTVGNAYLFFHILYL